MAISPPYLDEKPRILFYKNKDYPQRAKGISFLVLIFSIFVYISIFYIFNLSPSLNNTKLWFLVCNTLILIIAADYGVFSSSSQAKNDVYDEYYVMHSQLRSTVSSFASQYPQIVKKSVPAEEAVEINPPDEKEAINDQNDDDPDDKMVIFVKPEAESKPKAENFPEKKLEGDKKVDNNNSNNNEAVGNEKKLKETKTYRRSKSEKAKRVVIDESENIIVRRSASESEREEGEDDAEEDEYSTMSGEELNRRIEDFIQRFNRQIRLQRAGKFHQI